MRLIGIVGHAGEGKDLLAGALALDNTHLKTRTLKFADAARRECANAWRVPDGVFFDEQEKNTLQARLAFVRSMDLEFLEIISLGGHDMRAPRSPRDCLKAWATEFRRNRSHKNYWLGRLAQSLWRAHEDGVQEVYVADVRHLNEARFITAIGGSIVRVDRGYGPDSAHESESEVNRIEYRKRVMNKGSIEDLHRAARALNEDLLRSPVNIPKLKRLKKNACRNV